MRLGYLVTAVAGCLAATVCHAEPTTSGTASSDAGSRSYVLHVPAGVRAGEKRPLLVALHGCLQTPEQFAGVARLNALADARQLFVLYPTQSATANPMRCWNWFDAANQSRDAGEAGLIKSMVDQVRAIHPIDPTRIYVAGISAGGFMTSILLACYPDVFAAGAVVLGGMYKAAETLSEGMSVLRSASPHDARARGEQAWKCSGTASPRRFPVLVIDGDSDAVVAAANATQAVEQFATTNDYGDDGVANGSVPRELGAAKKKKPDGKLEYTCREVAARGAPLVRHCTVHGLGHAWSGGDANFPYAEPKGPDATALMWSFLEQHTRRQ